MGFSKFPAALLFAAAVVVMTTVASSRVADATNTSCAASLAPCTPYFNITSTPPPSCCGPMKLAVENDMPCLCYLYTTPGLLASYGINVEQAMSIPFRCNIVSIPCGKAPAPAPALALTPTSTSAPAPAHTPTSAPTPTPGKKTSAPAPALTPAKSGKGSSGVGRIASDGLHCLLLFWASMMLY